jgi:hypothetical protein
MRSVYEVIIKEQAMNFVYEDISKEDYEKFGIGELKAKYQSKNFEGWVINEARDIYLISIPDTFANLNNPDDIVNRYVMNIRGLWVDFESNTLESGGEYGGETWVKYGIKKIVPYAQDETGLRKNLSKNELPIAYEVILSLFCDALTVESNWWGRNGRTKHTVTFENLTQKVEV